MSTTPIQVRLSTALVEAIDKRAAAANVTRAEVLRELVAAALNGPEVPEHDPLFERIGDALGTLLARTDTMLDRTDRLLEVGHSTRQQARAAYATAHLHALTMLPTVVQQQAFIERLKDKLS